MTARGMSPLALSLVPAPLISPYLPSPPWPPLPIWADPLSGYSLRHSRAAAERSGGAPSVHFNARRLLPQGAWPYGDSLVSQDLRRTSLEPGFLTPRPDPSYWSGLPKVPALELKGYNSSQTGEFRPHAPNPAAAPWGALSKQVGAWSIGVGESSRPAVHVSSKEEQLLLSTHYVGLQPCWVEVAAGWSEVASGLSGLEALRGNRSPRNLARTLGPV